MALASVGLASASGPPSEYEFVWTIDRFSKLGGKQYTKRSVYSGPGSTVSSWWRALFYPKGLPRPEGKQALGLHLGLGGPDHFALYLCLVQPESLPGFEVHYTLIVHNRSNPALSVTKSSVHRFFSPHPMEHGRADFMPLKQLHSEALGFVRNDMLTLGAKIRIVPDSSAPRVPAPILPPPNSARPAPSAKGPQQQQAPTGPYAAVPKPMYDSTHAPGGYNPAPGGAPGFPAPGPPSGPSGNLGFPPTLTSSTIPPTPPAPAIPDPFYPSQPPNPPAYPPSDAGPNSRYFNAGGSMGGSMPPNAPYGAAAPYGGYPPGAPAAPYPPAAGNASSGSPFPQQGMQFQQQYPPAGVPYPPGPPPPPPPPPPQSNQYPSPPPFGPGPYFQQQQQQQQGGTAAPEPPNKRLRPEPTGPSHSAYEREQALEQALEEARRALRAASRAEDGVRTELATTREQLAAAKAEIERYNTILTTAIRLDDEHIGSLSAASLQQLVQRLATAAVAVADRASNLIRAEARVEAKRFECRACGQTREQSSAVAVSPCGHVFCAPCASGIERQTCPKCRQRIGSTLRISF